MFPTIAGLFPSNSQFALDWVQTDVAGANKLLDDAGWVKGSDGVRAKGGVKLSGELLSYAPQLSSISIPLAEAAKAVGFDLAPKRLEGQVWRSAVADGSFALTMQNNENFGINGDITATCRIYFRADAPCSNKCAGTDRDIREACDKRNTGRSPATGKCVLQTLTEQHANLP